MLLRQFYQAPEDGAGVPGAEQAVAGADSGANNAGDANGGQQPEKQTIDMEQAERIAQERAERATRSALTDYYKQQGLTAEEAKQAFEAYKAQREERKQAQLNDVTALQQENAELTRQLQQSDERAQRALILARAESVAHSMGVKADRVPHAVRLATLKDVQLDEQGNPDDVAIRTALDQVLKEIPELKHSSEENSSGFKLGAQGQSQGAAQASMISNIFGNNERN